ncbi:MAG: hypothetical protein R3F43_23395 [bacterium]
MGDHLVFLRKGRLYAADVSTPGMPRQTDTIAVAPEAALNDGVWYDELLVRGRVVFVVGFRYVTEVEGAPWIFGATEIAAFGLDEDGRFQRRGTTFIESNDYFSASNYASRMIGGQLVFYMPFDAFTYDWEGDAEVLRIPQVLTHQADGRFTAARPLFAGRDVAHGDQPPTSPVFHTVVTCEVGTGGERAGAALDCRARSLLGEWARQFYVTADRVFIWTSNAVFAVRLDNGEAQVHSAEGDVATQLNLKFADGALHATVERWDPVEEDNILSDGETVIEHLVLPLADFDGRGGQPLADIRRVPIYRGQDWVSLRVGRYVDGWYLGSLETWDFRADVDASEIVAIRLADGAIRRLPTAGAASRIEAMPGLGALVVSSEGDGLDLTTLRLGDEPRFLAPTRLPGAAEAESRTHGFFFRPDASGGLMGLAVLGQAQEAGWWGSGVGNLAFFSAALDGAITHAGTISSSPEGEGVCETSCFDWYGNTRPIFLRDRAFAMMGSELVELSLDDGVRETGARLVFSVPR